ncbi:tRNA pseudouridine(55) synthase TruB [Rubrobacter xylanophilus]|uniref:tRNA pseudouridine(55) synthase TruB n=1 Tax=Rubrobacter xylanophilus TaxID=49319 RepID=UPI00237A8BCD|nr:tRNA pseudouridine(55) synthase TruB [Rubrobacter xylanophilus]
MLLDKPPGITSARAVSLVKRLLPRRTKVGHTGTLDPLASGLLVILIGRATRLSRYVTGLDKAYVATARFGAASDTLDADGEILEEAGPIPPEAELRRALPDFTGEISQLPPMASAVKVGGRRLYELHRRGMEVEREPRRVRIHSLELLSFDPPTATFAIRCSSGTYVRSLVADLASSLGTAAYLTALRRTRVGPLRVEDALPPERLDPSTLHNRIIPAGRVLSHLPALEADEGQARAVAVGRPLRVAGGLEGSFRVQRGEELLAVYRARGGRARPEVVLCGG